MLPSLLDSVSVPDTPHPHVSLFAFQRTQFDRINMRVSGLLPLLLAALPAAALNKDRGLLGFALGNQNADSSCKTTDDYLKDFDALKDLATLVRTYSASNCDTAKNIIPAAKEKGFKVVLGVWYVPYRSIWDRDLCIPVGLTFFIGPTLSNHSTRTSERCSRACPETRTSSVRSLLVPNVSTVAV